MQIWTARGLPSGAGWICKAQHGWYSSEHVFSCQEQLISVRNRSVGSLGQTKALSSLARCLFYCLTADFQRSLWEQDNVQLCLPELNILWPSLQQCVAQGLPEPEVVSLHSAVAHGHLAESVLPEHESTLFRERQLTKQCPTGDAVLDKWHVLYFPFI